MVRKKLKLEVILSLIMIVMLTGCSTTSPSIIDTSGLSPSGGGAEKEDGSNYEMVKLSNGVIVYKDKSLSKKEPSEDSSSGLAFGPREINFDVIPNRHKE